MSRVAVIGAGPAGLWAARRAVQRGHDVVVHERGARPGGMAASFEVDGVRVDHGSHRFHPATDDAILREVDAPVQRGDALLQQGQAPLLADDALAGHHRFVVGRKHRRRDAEEERESTAAAAQTEIHRDAPFWKGLPVTGFG